MQPGQRVLYVLIFLFDSRIPVLMVTGQKSVFNGTTHALHQKLLHTTDDKAKVEFIEVQGIANVLEERVGSLIIYNTINRTHFHVEKNISHCG